MSPAKSKKGEPGTVREFMSVNLSLRLAQSARASNTLTQSPPVNGKNHSGKHDKICALGPILTRTARVGSDITCPTVCIPARSSLALVNQPACSTLCHENY